MNAMSNELEPRIHIADYVCQTAGNPDSKVRETWRYKFVSRAWVYQTIQLPKKVVKLFALKPEMMDFDLFFKSNLLLD